MAFKLTARRIIVSCGALAVFIFLVNMIDLPKSVPANVIKLNEKDGIWDEKLDDLQEKVDLSLKESEDLLKSMKESLASDLRNQEDQKPEYQLLAKPSMRTVLPVLVMACDRVSVARCLDALVRHRPDARAFPIVVSQDCDHGPTAKVIENYTRHDSSITHVRQPDQSPIPLPKPKAKFQGYYKISRHYKFALNYMLSEREYDAVIIVEDDLEVSPDFFEYFLGTYPLLLEDPSLWCVSAWNDNGKSSLIEPAPELLHRTDFFPGLGWLLTRDSWAGLAAAWPEAFFDDWLRNPENTGGRACVRPEVSRTYSFGKVGVSKGLFFDMHLKYISLNLDYVDFTKLDLSYLLKDRYDHALEATVAALPARGADAARAGSEDAKVLYHDAVSFRRAAKLLGLMDDFRSGIPRTAYRGVVSCYINNHRVYLVPAFEWTKYDPNWS